MTCPICKGKMYLDGDVEDGSTGERNHTHGVCDECGYSEKLED